MTTPALRFAVLGDPIAHSKSPALHGAAYRALGLPHTYEAIRTTEHDLPALVAALRAGTYAGFNVTVPHKQRVLALCDAIDSSAERVAAANTLVVEAGRVVAYNTDVPALAAELAAMAPERSPQIWGAHPALVIGTGGAARAAMAALSGLGVKHVTVRSRRGNDAATALDLEHAAGSTMTITHESLATGDDDFLFHTVVQCTSLGMHGADAGEHARDAVDWEHTAPTLIAYDVVYNPAETPFLRAAREHGRRAMNGEGMLRKQGALAFERWLGVPFPALG